MTSHDQGPVDTESIHPATSIGSVHLTVSDLSRSLDFYEDVLGLRRDTTQMDDRVALSVAGAAPPHVVVHARPGAQRRRPGTTGLYHFALLVPSREALARVIRRLVERRWPINGASDHGVSEAIYLSDPDGNGIEVYADRAREEWPYRDGEVQMVTEPLDLASIMSELREPNCDNPSLHPDTHVGHIHLHVSDLERARWFYHDVLGFDIVAYYGRQALFVSAGGYHHHIGLNTWAGVGASPPAPDAVGLRRFTIIVPSHVEVERLAERLRGAGVVTKTIPGPRAGIRFRDHDRIGIEIRSEALPH